jgi:septum formation protein
MTMRPLSAAYVAAYLDRYWSDVAYCAGAYRIEEEGARLFSRIDGDFFAVQGLPLLEILSYLALKGVIES